MHHPDPAASRQHPQHDLTLIAGLAADDLTPIERSRAQALLDGCRDCAALRDDLLVIAAATRDLPAALAPRDFRLTAEQAARLRRSSWLARLLRPLAGAGSVARPLAATFTTLGLVGVFVAAALPGMLGSAASMTAPESLTGAGVTSAAASAAPASTAGTPQVPGAVAGHADDSPGAGDAGFGAKDNAQPTDETAYALAGSDGRTFVAGDAGVDARDLSTPTRPNPLLVGSLAFLAVGLVLFALRFAGRRLRA